GPRRRIPAACDTPGDFFALFMPDNVLQHIADLTNVYGERDKENDTPHTRAAAAAAADENQWTTATLQEIKAFLGCLIYMGIVCMDDTRAYWAEETRQRAVADVITRDRFFELQRNFRPSEDEGGDEDRLSKLRFLISTLEDRLLAHFYPSK